MSQEGYDKLIAELHRLEAIERPKASAAIAEAREKGYLSLRRHRLIWKTKSTS